MCYNTIFVVLGNHNQRERYVFGLKLSCLILVRINLSTQKV